MGLKPWELLESKEAFRNRWWNIVQETVRFPDGSVTDDYYVNHSSGGVAVFAMTESGNVLLNRQYKHGAREIVDELTVGRIDPPSPDGFGGAGGGEIPLDAAKRELREETGYEGGEWEELPMTITNATSSTSRMHAYLARGVRKVAEPQADPRETIEVREVAPKELLRMAAAGELKTQTALATVFLAAERLGWISSEL